MIRSYAKLPPLPLLPGQGKDAFPAFNPTPVKPTVERLYTVPEVGEYLRIGPRPIYKAIAEGHLVSSFIGRSHMVTESNLAAFIKNQEKATSWHGRKVIAEVK